MATIDVRQVEQKAQRRTLRVAVLAFALLVAASALLALFAGSGRRMAVPQIPNWPQSSTLVQRPGTSAQASITIRFRSGVSPAEQRRLLRRFGAVETGSVPALRLHVVSVTPAKAESLLHQLRLQRSIAEAGPDDVRQIAAAVSDPAFSSQWALDKIGWSSAFRTVKAKRQVTVAVLDTGVDGANRDFAGRLTGGFSVFGSKPTSDPHGHGTWMASIAAAAANNRYGIAGVAFSGARIMPVQVLNAQGYGRDSDIVAGVVWAADHGANVILMSFAGPGYSPALQSAVDYAWSKGAIVVAATGNNGSSAATYPAGDAHVVGVSATDNRDRLWSGSNSGPATFLAAPGVGISADAVGGGTTSITGSSASAALVAGSAALLLAADPKASNRLVIGKLAESADRAGTRSQTGNGRLNLRRALGRLAAPITPLGVANRESGGPFAGPYVAAASTAGAPTQIGAAFNGNSATGTITVGAAGVPAGSTVFLTATEATAVTASGTWSATDSGGNTYVVDKEAFTAGTSPRVALLRARITTALVNTNTITITPPVTAGTPTYTVTALYFPGLIVSPLDQTGAASGASGNSATATSGTTAQAQELVLGAVGSVKSVGLANNSCTAFGLGGTMNTLQEAATYKEVAATGAQTCGTAVGNNNAYAVALGTYKIDVTNPNASVFTFPTGTPYNASGWTGSIAGTASDTAGGSGIASDSVSIHDDTSNQYWTGAAWSIAGAAETYNAAVGTTSWTYAFASTNLADGHTYTLHARSTDGATNQSSVTSQVFTYDTSAPTMSSATVASNGTTVTVTWSENLDQTQAVPGSAFSIAPNGGAGIGGTAAAVTYPAANQTQFTLSSAIHHLDSLALTYTKPGSNPMIRDMSLTPGNATATATLNNASITNNTTNVSPSTPTLVSPADAARVNSTTPTLTATFLDPDTQDTGKVTFEVCTTSNCSSSLGTFDSTSTNLAVNANGSAAVPAGYNLANGTTYYWRAKNVDSSAAVSSFSAIQSFVVDTTPPTMSSAVVAADGVTVTVTWSENLDQTQAVPGSSLSISPNGGAGVAGTATAVSYPAANQTRFTLSSTVHHLDSLALTYTKPGSNPMLRDTALPVNSGNAAATATLTNASITNNTTNASPSTPTLVSPADATRMNNTTPTLTAKFLDPDTQDTGKVTFEVCTTGNCSSSLGTFDSTSTNLAVNANGSAAVPAGYNLANGTTYYWRAKNVDSSAAASSFSAIQSFVVDMTAPTMSSATVAADGVTVTITWSENLDQTQAVPGSSFSISPNGGAGVAGTAAAVSYPAANQARFTLSSTVHRLDSLALTYTKPGSDPMVRDTALATGNPAATATLNNASITNNTTNVAPSTPTLVSPADAARLNTATPTLTATFSDPDTQDAGKVTFEVCTTSNCSSSLGTFDSTSTNLAVNANGSAAVPAGFNLVSGTYYWRAKNVDSAAASSSFSATQSFVVDITPPTMSSAAVATDGVTVTITWSESVDQTQAVVGSSFSIAPNGGAGVAGIAAAVSYPAANQTRFTLSSTVHHLDSLALTYTKPGSDPMVRDTAPPAGNAAATATLNNASITNNTTNVGPSTPTLVSPADASRRNTATPTLTATFLDPDTQDTGKVTFEVCTTTNCSSSLGTFDSTSTNLAVNANGSAAVPAGYNLANGTTYYWRAKNVDSSAASSSFSATQSFLVDTATPTMSSATVAADGVTVTITWSESLDQVQAVPGNAFSITPNGGSAIAGTATAVSYPAANQTRFTLFSTLHHLDTLALTYTKPGSDPMVRDTALATGNPAATATLLSGSITNNTTNVAPSTPTLVSPADAARLNTTTPTLTATFGDPDSQDTGKVTFEVCTTSNCSSSLGTFDSTSTNVAVNANGSAAVPGGFSLASGTTYYWRAKNVDSSAASSSFGATQSFLVDTAAPTMSSATVAADGTTVTVTWSENLDQTQGVAGSSFGIAPNGGSGVTGTATVVSYPAANQTRFTLSSAVHHLDSLALTYTKPGSDPMVRDTALATGNPAATATVLNASITNNTSNISASTPALVSPANAARLNTATPTLTATFLDPDSQDTGKVTFEICSTNNCSSSLGTFDSTSSSLGVNANGGAAVPAGFNLASGTTYYWRAENVDSSAASSSFTSTRSFLVDTTAPTMSSATVAADGTTVTITWSENLDQTQAVPGSAYAIAPNGGSGIAGTGAAVSYPAANQTRFTLSSAVHHLDSLALTYTKPGTDPMVRDTALATGNPAATATLNNASITNNTSNVSPSTPTLVSPADAARLSTTTPTLTATFLDPDTQDIGKVTFEVCTTSNCSTSLGTFDSTSSNLAVNANGSAAIPAGYNLADGTTYYWRAKNVDSAAASSSFSAIQSFVVDTAAPTITSAVVATDGVTVTATWSENLDQTQAVAGSSFSIAPNGGAGVAGTAAAVSYPAANQTRFTLSSTVHHLDSLALTYTKPGSDPMVRDTALATGNAAATATLTNASITNNTTNASPSTPTFVSPADAAHVNTATPTLTATFLDPDSQDAGKVTFEVCTTSNCSSSLGTFDSTSTTLAVNANGSAAVPAGYNLTSGTTYYWRAENVDSSAAASSFSAIQSFVVDTAPPTMSAAVVAADGVTVTVTWSDNLDQTQAVPGSAFSITPNGGVGIAGTAAAISYPAANQARFTLFSAVHHLDTLALSYTKPGTNPMIRGGAGTAAVTATLDAASITNDTANASPSTPTLVSPADGARLNTTTPTLTATFSDPDSQDNGKVTFEVCTTSNCSSSLGTFDSTSTNLTVGTDGSAAVPGGFSLASGTTYYWRAKNVDSSAAGSSFTATRSFLVDTTAPAMSSATVAADGTTVTITWSENLDQTQALPGNSFSVAPNGGAGIAGTAAAVSYPAANQTRVTLSSAVHHLDSLALTYTKPGSNPMVRDTAVATGNPATTATLINASITNNTANVSASTPTLVSPADAARVNTPTPTLSATFLDPDSLDTGKVTFEVCSTNNCSSSLGTFDSTSTNLAVNANGSAAVPAGFNLASGTTYYWRAENVDSSAAGSSWTATRSFLVDTTAPTMSSATLAADGTTVTVTWSENLDQTEAVPGSSFSIAPNGGAGIAGTATAVSYTAANQTRFTLSSAVHHLDSLALTYTKPGSGPMARDTALAIGNAASTATLNNASITNNTTNASPSTPTFVSPADAARLNTTTPTLTAIFGDPDTQDTGKVTFEVCTTSNCSSSLGTFDSTSTTLTVGSNGSATVPGGYNLASGSTYYWRAKNVDASAAGSSFTATRSFVVDTAAPTMSSATVAADGVTVTVTWSENLDQTEAVPGNAFSVTPNGGVGIAGTAAPINYPAANQTRFTLFSAVHHLDALALTYTKPGSDPMVRDAALAAGNPAATATLTNASITNSTTNAGPSTPTLVSPADAARLRSTTPTLTATFLDPDSQDSGKVTFEVCTTSNCSSSLGTFDSTSTNLAVNADGSAAVPAGYGLADGTTYYWRAKNVDASAAASGFSAIQSFIVDTTAPTMSSAVVAADGVTVTVTWSESLDQTQPAPGSAFSIAPNGGAGIAGTASAVSYPAADQTQFTLSSDVDHLDSLALTYTKPGSNPRVRDVAANSAATATLNNASITNNAANAAPSTPTSVGPADAARLSTATPTLTATFLDPDSNDSGKVTFEVCATSNCSSSLGTFDSSSTNLAVNANGSAAVPGGFNLASGTTYYWRAQNVDSSAASSSFSTTRSFLVDTAAPTMSSAVVAANGTTVTVTWSESLDQTQAVDGSSFSIAPNGGAGVAGTAATVTYPAADQTRFTLSSAVQHLDSLALTYTKPGSDPMVRDTALATGNAAATATLTNASITNNTTNASPSTPTLVGPADAIRLNTTTPTLTATFGDPDTQDSGKVTFEVCTTSNCSSSLGTFDSTGTNLTVGANGSAAVPAGFNLASGTTYYWRAENVDSSAAGSSSTATRSFLVDTAAPTMSSAVVAADGTTATVTWSESLDQTESVPGSAFSIAPNGGAGIAGTAAAVSYPAANQTRFTLSSAVHHLDTLALSYTRPGSDPMVRDTALATGNPATTASGISVTNNATNLSPNAATLVTPNDGQRLNTTTPVLTATFSDPDVNDTGSVTFQVCANATCTAGGDPVSTFSSGSGTANGANATASVPGAANLSDGPYYWRAKNVDSSAAGSAYGATRSFTVDTTGPAMSSATVGADGVTVTVTWSENLDQTEAVLGSAFGLAPNGGSSIGGTAAVVSYPAANQTRFTLSSAVHHLDTLGLAYTNPGSGPVVRDLATPVGNAAVTGSLANGSITNNTATLAPNVPALVGPAGGARLNTPTPTLTATFSDPDSNDSGKVTFQVCSDSGCSSSLGTVDSTSTSIAVGANGSAAIPGGTITADGTYYWRAKNVDASAAASSYSATRSFTVDTTAPAMSSASVGGDGTTVTVTWSENLDQGQAVPGSSFSIAPNGGSGIAGTASAVSYPAADKTRFTLSSAINHLDTLDLTYTKPGSDPMVRDAATVTGNAAATATLGDASITNNTTDTAPTTPALVSPADGTLHNTATPTLSATFTDPDPNDSGKVTFQVCSDSGCSSSLGTVDSTSTSIAVGANGSAAIPGGTITADGTYYWRAKNVDASAAASSYSATRSFTVDTTAPTMSSASVAANGTTVTITWSENLDQGQAVPGSAFSIAPNGGAGIAGTAAAVSYPAADQTRFTLSSAVHHLDTLGLTYTKPGSDPMIRDTAPATGNAAVTATLANAFITNNTANAGPTVPVLVNPGDTNTVGSYTPTLTATFSDPDTNDTGKITFEVCTTNDCSTSLGTFDSTNTSLANNQSGSAQVPAGYGLIENDTYYWRAKSTDSGSSVSSFSSIWSFTPITDSAPDVPSLVSPAGASYSTMATPTLMATFTDPDPSDTGTITFRICGNATCTAGGDPILTFASASGIANGADGAAAVPAGLSDGSYFWQARSTDDLNVHSVYSAGRSLTIDATAPTNVFSLTGVSVAGGFPVAFYPGTGSTIYYNGAAGIGARSFSIRAAVTDATSGPASVTTQSFAAGGSNMAHTDATTTAPGSGVFDTNSFTYTALTTGNASVDVFTSDLAGNASSTTSFTLQNDAAAPSGSVTSPAAGAYNASGWTGTLTGSAADGGAGVDAVKVSIRDVTAGGSSCWNGTGAFDQPCPNFVGATGTTSWSYGLAAGALTDGHTYAITVETIDKIGNTDAAAATRSFDFDTSAPTITAANVASDGVTVTATWSENLDQAQAVAGSAFSVTPNGGSAVAGTGAAVTYPAANKTRFTLSAAVHHADVLTLDYAKPGGNPMVRDTVTPTGNPAVTAGGLAVTNNTADIAPTTPALAAPADSVFINSTTPTLSATFSDPDPTDTGKVTFEVCSASNCSTSLGTFQSTTVANGANGSAQVPGAFNVQTATTYYWRALNIDGLNATSSFSSTRSFSVDTTAPSLSITAPQAVTGNGFQYYDGTTTKLWLNADQAGSFKLTSSASDAQSGVASVDFPAIFSTGGNAGTLNAGTYESSTYAFDGTVTPFASPGAKTVTASNGVTVPAPNTTNGQITIAADGAAPTAFALGEPADGTTVRQTTVSAAPTDGAGSGIREVAFSFCDVTSHPACDPTNTGLFGVQIGSTQTIAAGGIYSVTWTDVLTDGHQYALAAVATDNVGHTRTSTLSTVTVDSSAPNVAVAAPNAVSGGQYQHYDTASKTLWLNSHQAGSFTLAATANDPHSGISSVTFPALLGSSSNVGSGSGTYTSGATYTFDGTGTPLTAPGAKSITAANGVTDPSPGTSSDALTVDVDGVAPATSAQFPLNNGSYDNTTWNVGSAGCTGAPASGICGTVADPGSSAGVAAVKLSIKDSTTGLYYDGAAFTQGSQSYLTAPPSGSNWSYGLDQSKLTSPHVYVIELFAVDNVGNAELHQTIRFTYGSDVGAPATALTLTGATNASLYQASGSDYNLYYRTTGGNGGFTLHAVSTDPSGVDTVTFPNLSATAGFSGSGGTSTNGSNADPYTVDSSGYSFTSAATTPPGQKAVTSVDLRGNSGDDTLTFLLDNAPPTGGTLTVNSIPATLAGASAFVNTTTLLVGHLDYLADGAGSGVASSSLTVASATLANGTCGGYGADAPASDGVFTATDGTCYRFTLTGTDRVGNATSIGTTLKVDTTAPSQPGVTFTGLSSGNTFDDAAGTLYYRPSAAGTFTVNANGSTDAESGVKAGNPGYTFSSLANFAGATQTGNRVDVTFNGASTGSGSYIVHSTDNAGLDSADASFSITADSVAPINGALSVNGTAATAGGSSSYLTAGTTIAIGSRTDYTDASSGIASSTLTMQSATLANDTCGSFGSASTIAGTTSQSVSDAQCYLFTLTGTDHVGNSTSLSTIVKVDTTAPVAPSVSFSGLSTGNIFVSGSTLFYRPSSGGTFTVNANGATDPETGIKPGNAGYTFSALSGFASTAQTGNRLDVTFDAASTGSGADSVAAVNNASVGSSATAFTVTADAAAPTGGALSINPYSGSLTVSIGETPFADGASGIASNVLTRSSPQAPSAGVCPGGGYSGSIPATLSDTVPTDGQCYEYTLTGTDNVGNVATYDAIVLVDTTGPAGGSIQYVDGPASLSSVSVDWDSGTDAESGIGTVRVERASATVTGATCDTLGGFSTLIANATVSPIVDPSVTTNHCYAYRIVVTNNAGVDSTFSSPSVARLTSALPIQLAPGNPAGSILNGSTLYLGPSSANLPFKLQLTALGANGVTSATWQGKSGSLQSAPATDTTTTTSPFNSGVYTWDGTAPLNDSIQVSRDPGATVDSVNVVSDTSDPTGTITYTDGIYASRSVHVATTATDGQSGVASTQVMRADTTLTGATCDTAAPSWSSFSAITLSGGGNDTTVTDSHCYRYEVVVTDNVGNSYTAGSANVAKIPDITAPTFLTGSTNAAGTQLTLTMSEPLDASATTQPGAFTITYDGVVQPTATGIGFAGQSIVLNLASAPNNSETVKVRYSQPSAAGDRVRDTAAPTENESANFGPIAVVNNTTDTVAPSLVSASVNSTNLTLVFNEALAGTAPDASAFAVSTGGTSRSVTGVSMSGKTITFTIAPAVGSADNVVVSYAVPAMNALHDAAGNPTTSFVVAAANQTPIVPPADTAVPAPAPASPVFVSSSPNDGSTVRAVSTITLTASQSADWTNMNVTRPDGSVTALQDASGQAATWAFAPTAEGLYVIRGTLSGGGATDDVLSHFTIWAPGTGGSNGTVPEVQKNAVPFAAGELESSDGLTLFDWSADTFSDAVVVEVKPRPAAALAGLPADAVVVDVTAFVRSTHAPVSALNGVADIRFPHAAPGSHPLTSQDGTTWREISQLPTLNLPAGQTDGWFADSDGTIHVLTRHLTFYALVGPQTSTKLAMRVLTVRRLWLQGRSFMAVRMSLTTPARVTGSFVGPDGSIVPGQTIRTPTRHAGVTILRVPLRVTKPGLYRLQMHAEGAGQVVNRTALIRFLAKRPASPVWQDVRPLRIAVVRGVKGLGSLGDRLGHGYLVRGVADSALYTVVDTKFPTAAAAVVVDLGTVPASTLATLHALLPEVKIVGLTGSPARALYYRSVGVSAVLPRTASAATVAKTIKSLLR